MLIGDKLKVIANTYLKITLSIRIAKVLQGLLNAMWFQKQPLGSVIMKGLFTCVWSKVCLQLRPTSPSL